MLSSKKTNISFVHIISMQTIYDITSKLQNVVRSISHAFANCPSYLRCV